MYFVTKGLEVVDRRVLVLGNLGYVGPAVVEALRKGGKFGEVVGFDAGFFELAASTAIPQKTYQVDVQHYGDVRDINATLLSGFDAVVYLAAVSNDPMGREFAAPTHEINNQAALSVAHLAKAAGVSSFVFASSCSVYGAGGALAKTEADGTEPLTDYARSKLDAEAALRDLANDHFVVTCLRFATACGPSPRLRLDLVLNDFIASAITRRAITILSDGSPLRPLIDVRDMGRAIDWAAQRLSQNGGAYVVVNAGQNDWNFSVLELARKVADHFDGVSINVADSAGPDNRSYRVDFSRFRELAPGYYPTRSIDESISAISASLDLCEIPLDDFRSGSLIRLNVLRRMIAVGTLDQNLRWT